MRKKILKILSISLVFVLVVTIYCNNFIYSATINASNVTLGQTININISLGNPIGAYKSATLKCNGQVIKSEGLWNFDSSTMNGISSKSYSYTPSSAGSYNFEFIMEEAVDFTTDSMIGTITASKTVTVTAPKTETTSNTTTTTKQTTANTTTSNNSNSDSQSSNNYLKTLEVSEEGLTPDFNKNKTSYSLSVGTKVTKIDVNAIAEDSSAKVSVSGNTELKDGDNNIYITVTAANGTKRTYTIVVNRSDDPEKSNSYLQNLIIRDMKLTPDFASETFEYDGGTIKTNDDKLDIYAYPTNENAKVEIIGNENLKNGENTVKIKITSEDGNSTKEYVIKFIKEDGEEISALGEVEEENLTPKQEIKKIFKEIWQAIKANGLLLLMYLLVLVEFVQILYLYKKLKQKEMPNDEEQEEDKKEFDKYNISLDEAKYNENATNILKELDEKEMLNEPKDELVQNIEENTEHEIPQEVEEKIGDTVEELPKVEEEVIERKVRTIWDEERPNFLEGLEEEEEVEDKPKRRRGGRKGND